MKKIFALLLLISIVSFFLLIVFAKETMLYQASIHLGILSLAMFLLWNIDLKTTLADIGFAGSIWNTSKYFVLGLASIIFVMMIVGIVANNFNLNDQHKISQKISTLPTPILFIAILVAPISEELLFRGYLTKRFGILPASILFGIIHITYGSLIEIIGATLIGMIFGAIYLRSRSITPCILIHMFYNFLSIVYLRFLT